MFQSLKNHPFAVEAYFESSIVLTFAVPREELQNLIPACLELDCFNEVWAFIAVAMVQTTQLRPKGFPKFLGNSFFLIGYRIFVRYTTNAGKKLRGLYILKSETNKRQMQWLGNLFTKYKYTTTDIIETSTPTIKKIKSIQSKFEIIIDTTTEDVVLPQHSPFKDWKEARRFAGPLPFTFSFHQQSNEVLMIEGVRENWKPVPLKIISYDMAFLDSLNLKQMQLANAFIIKDIPYYWKKGSIEKWKQ